MIILALLSLTSDHYLVRDFDDETMVRIYARENATQRWHQVTAIDGSVLASVRLLVKQLLNDAGMSVGTNRHGIFESEKSFDVAKGYHLPLDVHPVYGNNVQLATRLELAVEGGFAADSGPALGLLGRPIVPVDGFRFAAWIEKRLGRTPLHIPGQAADLGRIAWCTGAAQALIEAAVAQGVDAFLTGEVSEQTVHIARETGIHFYAAGHHATERYGVQALGQHLAQQFQLDFSFIEIDNPV